MSDDWIALIPEDPHYIPDPERQKLAQRLFGELAPDAESVEAQTTQVVTFFHCGGNFERVLCPSCGVQAPIEWWQDRMCEDELDEGFKLTKYVTPCCGSEHTLHELNYDWPQGFGRFALCAMNANIGRLDEPAIAEFERILGTKLRTIYKHI